MIFTECVPYSQTACIRAIQAIGYQVATNANSGYTFEGDYGTKGMF